MLPEEGVGGVLLNYLFLGALEDRLLVRLYLALGEGQNLLAALGEEERGTCGEVFLVWFLLGELEEFVAFHKECYYSLAMGRVWIYLV